MRKLFLMVLAICMLAVLGFTGCDGSIGDGGSVLPEGALSGAFSVSATDKVHFSQGNLQATYSTSSSGYIWGFAEHQYDYVGKAVRKTPSGTQADGAKFDLFRWVGKSGKLDAYGINIDIGYDDDFSTSTNDSLKDDWGNIESLPGNSSTTKVWRTLSKDEWVWLLGSSSETPNPGTNCRESSNVNGTANARYAEVIVNGVEGLIIFPDTFTWNTSTMGSAPVDINTYSSTWNTTDYTAAQFEAMEEAGIVFLPAAGAELIGGVRGFYWSSTAYDSRYAYSVSFWNEYVGPAGRNILYCGLSVRLACEAE